MDDLSYYTFADPTYFETLTHFTVTDEYSAVARQHIPNTWLCSRSDIWLNFAPPSGTIPVQGFKVHLSISPRKATEALHRILPILVDRSATFKLVADSRLHCFLNSKRYHRSGSGKFATIYPRNNNEAKELMEVLSAITNGYGGPYILSDRRFRDSSVVYYRYGAFKDVRSLQLDGSWLHVLRTRDGSYQPDERVPYFRLPEGVSDPFVADAEIPDEEEALLNNRYSVDSCIGFTNSGGVYRATDTLTGNEVVLKEARPHILSLGRGVLVESRLALRHEAACLESLQGIPGIPAYIDFFTHWEHEYLVSRYCEGKQLSRLRANEDVILIDRIHDKGRLAAFCTLWRDIALQLLNIITLVHQRGILLGDLSPENVLYDRASGTLHLVDFESSLTGTEEEQFRKFASSWAYPGFRTKNTHTLTEQHDFYAAGMVLYNLLCPVQSLFDLDPRHNVYMFIDYLCANGVPRELRWTLRSLLDGAVKEALATLNNWLPTPEYTAEAGR